MDNIQHREDKETPSLRPDRIQAFLHLFIGTLFFLGSLMIFSALSAYICSIAIYGEFHGFSELGTLVADLENQSLWLNIFVFLSSTLPLIIAAYITLLFMKANPSDFLLLQLPREAKWLGWSFLFILVSIPLMGFMLEINNLINFKQWPDLYAWLMEKEATNNGMYESLIGDRSASSFGISLLFMALLPAFAEEVFFRGFLMNIFNGIFNNMHLAILFTALLFSMMHLQFMKVVPMFFLATVFGYVVYWTGSLWTAIAAHFLNNTLAVVQLFYFSDGDYQKSLDQSQSMSWSTHLFLLGIAIFLFIFIQKRSSTKTTRFYV
jgi:uncharacterized protein